MYYRYEARHIGYEESEWEGIFSCFTPYELRKWYCLTVPKWYEKNPDVESQAWFTQHGYDEWHTKMEKTIEEFLSWGNDFEVRLCKAEKLDNVVFAGKTQCIVLI